MTICPCCGFKFEGDLRLGCQACGARAVGDPLPKPERILPAYGRTLVLVVIGTLTVLAFIAEIIIALVQRAPISLSFASLELATQTAAWHLKWAFVPVTVVILWSSGRIYRSMLRAPSRFVGMRVARGGLVSSVLVILFVATLITVLIPTRLRERRLAIEAGFMAQGYTLASAQLEYRALYGTFPSDLRDLRKLPDPGGAIGAALATLPGVDSPAGYSGYRPSADVVSREQPRNSRVSAIRASLNTTADDSRDEGVSFTNYDLRLPGADNLPNTDDDLILRDGVIMKASEVKNPAAAPIIPPVRAAKR